jgi:hypothetical protein
MSFMKTSHMRGIYTLFTAAALSTSVFAQTSYPFPDSGAAWVNANYSVTPFPPPATYFLNSIDEYCVDGQDTVINDIIYTQVHFCGGSYKGAWRDDEGVVYFVPGDSTGEYLIYDFTLDAGASTQVYFESNGQGMSADVEISNVYASTEYGGTRKVLQLNTGALWIEGIGASWGLFTEPWVNVSNYELRLECMSQLDSIHFPSEQVGAGTCSFTWGMHEQPTGPSFTLQPNPTQGPLRVIVPGQGTSALNVTDTQGRIVMSVPQVMSDGTLDVGALPNGMYALNVTNAGSRSTQRLVVQH